MKPLTLTHPRMTAAARSLKPIEQPIVRADNGEKPRGAVVERDRGEVIVEVNRHPVRSAADVRDALASVAKDSDALVLVWSNGGSTFRVLHPTQS